MYKIYCKICRGKTQFWVKTPILHTNTESLVSTPRRKIKNEKFNQVYASWVTSDVVSYIHGLNQGFMQ